MKVRDSGMPDEKMWNSFFNPHKIFNELELDNDIKDAVEFGSGYGTFTLQAAALVKGDIYALEIEEEMINVLQTRIEQNGINNIKILKRDFMTEGTGLKNNSIDYAMVFNILHTEEPVKLLSEAYRILKPGGKVGVIHWIYSSTTPRGPAMEIRPKPEQCVNWLEETKFEILKEEIELPPYHYGILGRKN